ncbi:hypothetical protein V1512DRAFT_268574 [Lipomyces arxii]|uniref:uncharacterized protein n=1 Tax=Lipomyces arxii TaxID=56418 RepID=UPI0034CD4A9A
MTTKTQTRLQSDLLKRLAANDRPTREKGLDSLSTLLSQPEKLDNLDMLKIWKGLYYCMWMADRPKVQESIATKLGQLVESVDEINLMSFIEAFWITICRDWRSIDVLRVDKYYLLIRRVVYYTFKRLYTQDWTGLEAYTVILSEYPLNFTDLKIPDAIKYHIIDIYIDELEKAIEGVEETLPISELMKPFDTTLTKSHNKTVKKRVKEELLTDERLKKWTI